MEKGINRKKQIEHFKFFGKKLLCIPKFLYFFSLIFFSIWFAELASKSSGWSSIQCSNWKTFDRMFSRFEWDSWATAMWNMNKKYFQTRTVIVFNKVFIWRKNPKPIKTTLQIDIVVYEWRDWNFSSTTNSVSIDVIVLPSSPTLICGDSQWHPRRLHEFVPVDIHLHCSFNSSFHRSEWNSEDIENHSAATQI